MVERAKAMAVESSEIATASAGHGFSPCMPDRAQSPLPHRRPPRTHYELRLAGCSQGLGTVVEPRPEGGSDLHHHGRRGWGSARSPRVPAHRGADGRGRSTCPTGAQTKSIHVFQFIIHNRISIHRNRRSTPGTVLYTYCYRLYVLRM